jgi:formiminotetrahydrofolate cyclodeaminase
VDAAQWYLQLDQFKLDQILEYRLASARREDQIEKSSLDFLDALADGTPAPGGGSAAAFSASAGAALVAMVARLTIGKKKYISAESQMQIVLKRVESLRSELFQAINLDAAAFESVMEAFRLPKGNDEETVQRKQAIQEATLKASSVPLEVAGKAVEVLELAEQVVAMGNLNAITDGATGAALAKAGLTGAGYNVRINVTSLEDKDAVRSLLNKLVHFETRAQEIEDRISAELKDRGGLSLE